jgi:Transcriptional regulator, AbiEi antitoxin
MGGKSSNAQQVVARIAAQQHGNVSRSQLLRVGLTARQIEGRVEKGLLIPQYRGVYRVGHAAPSTLARYMAAVLACGEGAALVGRAAAHLLAITTGSPPPPEVAARTAHRIPSLHCRRRRIDPRDRRVFRRIPTVSPAYVLVDLAAHLTLEALSLAAHRAGNRHRTTPGQVRAVLERRSNVKGAANLREVIGLTVPVSLSQLERAFIALLRKHGLPLPATNRRVGSHRVDCHWPEYGLTIELVSYRYHNTYWSWQQDHHRRREAKARGEEHIQYTWHDVVIEPDPTVIELRGLLSEGVETRTPKHL